MPRIRTVKPALARHELLFELERETGLPIRFAWALLPTVCDREGRFRWRPRDMKLDILPYDDCDFSHVLDAWLTRGQVVKYRVGHEWYGCVPTFKRHQHINNKEPGSELPALEEAEQVEDFRNQAHANAKATREAGVAIARSAPAEHEGGDASLEGKGKEEEEERKRKGKGTGENPSSKRVARASSTRELTPLALHASLPLVEWDQWLERRRRKRWPCDELTLSKQLALLAQYNEDTQRSIIDASLNAGWQGLFPPKANGHARPGALSKPKSLRSADDIEAEAIGRGIAAGQSDADIAQAEDLPIERVRSIREQREKPC